MNNQTSGRGRRNEKVGVVVSDKMNKTVRVEIARTIRHAKYGKYLRRSTVFMAHDETEQSNVGDTVLIVETRPMSKSKRWKVVEVVRKASEQGVGV